MSATIAVFGIRVYQCLLEAGRPDLAEIATCFTNDDGTFYVKPCDEVTEDDLALIAKAEQIANGGAA